MVLQAEAESASAETFITLESEDGQKLRISKDAAKGSQHLNHFMDSCNSNEAFPIKVVKGHILEKVIEYLNHYKARQLQELPKPLPAKNFRDLVPDWDYKFTSQELSTIFELLLAANYMDIPGLLDLCCARVASEIRGKSVDEIRTMFQIENDFTPDEEKKIREENRWCDPE